MATNDGARTAGVDRATVAQIETTDRGRDASWTSSGTSLKSGEVPAAPVRQVMIPKGGGKLRPLGIPTDPAYGEVA